jgi:hypothetical protein
VAHLATGCRDLARRVEPCLFSARATGHNRSRGNGIARRRRVGRSLQHRRTRLPSHESATHAITEPVGTGSAAGREIRPRDRPHALRAAPSGACLRTRGAAWARPRVPKIRETSTVGSVWRLSGGSGVAPSCVPGTKRQGIASRPSVQRNQAAAPSANRREHHRAVVGDHHRPKTGAGR